MSTQIVAATPVPFTVAGDVDLREYHRLLTSIEGHVDAALVAGTTGEFPALDDDERIELFGQAVQVLGADRVIAHLGHASTRQVLRVAEAAASLGINRFALLTPYYLPADDAGVVAFFRHLTEAHPGSQVYAYLFPERTGIDVDAPTLKQILELAGVAGVKLSGAAAAHLTAYAAVLQDGQALYSGNDATLPEVIAHGGAGVVSGVSTAFPETFAALARAIDAGDAAATQQLQSVVVQLVSLVGPTIPRLKAAIAARTGGTWASRMSLPAVDDSTLAAIGSAVAEHR